MATTTQRILRSLSLPLVALMMSCVSGLEVRKDYDNLQSLIQDLDEDYGRECAPESLAKAEALKRGAKADMQDGDVLRAQGQVERGTKWAKFAADESKTCRERMRTPVVVEVIIPDTDGDGILDDVDQCPEEAEDFDGNADEDGCPEVNDLDGDGIMDDVDRCPNQPEDFDGDQDEDGCPDITNDRDGDGIPDATDTCPDQPEDIDNFEDDDGCPDVDNDKDGIFDVVDRCPMETEDIDGFEDSDGCPDPDNDRDGLADVQDQCPDQAETMNGFEDEDGCPDSQMPKTVYIENSQIKIRDQIYFETGKATIKAESYGILNDVASVLKEKTSIEIRIEGHTDSQGGEVYNLNLSKSRAKSVLDYMAGQGVGAERMKSIGLGESSPIETNKTAEGRANNRRVEFHITAQ